jgi:hypothetical protein
MAHEFGYSNGVGKSQPNIQNADVAAGSEHVDTQRAAFPDRVSRAESPTGPERLPNDLTKCDPDARRRNWCDKSGRRVVSMTAP